MKKIYLSILTIAGTLQICNAQLTLTKAFNEPIIGDVFNTNKYDSTSAVPKATGAGQNWNFNTLTLTPNSESSTYTTVASTPSAGIFPAANLAEDQGSGDYTFYKTTPTAYEVQGIQFPGLALNFTNTAVFYTWPVSFGYSGSDTFGGTYTSTITTNLTGSLTMNGSGTGTVVMPGGLTLSNCLQTKSTINLLLTQGTFTQNILQTEYTYYHSSNKFPILTVHYEATTSGTVMNTDFNAKVNTAVVASLTKHEIENNFSVFPNPANESITVSLTNPSSEMVSTTLTNMLGQIVKSNNFGTEKIINQKLNVSELPNGLYIMNLKIGESISSKKIIIE